MALVVADRVQETSTTAGTGTLSLSGAVAGNQTFASGVGVGNTTYYALYDQTAQVWEVGLGTVGSGTLARTTVLANSSGTTSPLNLAGNSVVVWCDYPAEKAVYKDASGNVTLGGALNVTGTTTLATSLTGILKAASGVVSTAVSGTDYAPATSGTSILKGNGSGGFSSAVSGTDYAPATSGSAILYGNGSGGFSSVTIGSGVSFVGGTLSATGTGGTVTTVSVVSANGLAGTVANPTTTPAITLSTSVSGILKGNGTGISAAVAGTDYVPTSGTGATGTWGISISGNAATATSLSGSTSAQSIYALPDTGGSSNWLFLGTWSSANQSGSKLNIKIVISTGFNANPAQNAMYDVFFKTSNGSSSQSGSTGAFYADGTVWQTGPAGSLLNLRVIQNSATSYAIYANCATYSGTNSFYSVSIGQGTWTNSGTIATPSGNYVDLSIYKYLDSNNYTSYSPSLTGTGASGTWGISISGNAATATTTDNIDGIAFKNADSSSPFTVDTQGTNGIGYSNGYTLFGYTDGGVYCSTYSASWQHQINGDFRTGQIAIRGKNNGTWQSWRTVLDSGNYSSYSNFGGNSVYGGIYYDGNNTAYYLDAGGTSNLYAATVNSTWNFLSTQNTAYGGQAGSLVAYSSPGTTGATMSFHRPGYYAINMGLDSDNVFRIGGWSASGNRMQLDMSGNMWSASSMRSSIFYDQDNTGYYVDPNSTSNIYYLYADRAASGYDAGVSGSFSCNNWFRSSGGSGWYNATYGGGIWMQDSTWVRTYGSKNFYCDAVILSDSSVRAPIFYDSNDTGYYVDPNGTSNLNSTYIQGTVYNGSGRPILKQSGSILQVVSTSYSTAWSTTTNGFVSTPLALSITPSSTSSRIMVVISPCIGILGTTNDAGTGYGILRGATRVFSTSYIATYAVAGASTRFQDIPGITYVDSPATTSAVTYTLEVYRYTNNGGTTVLLNRNYNGTDTSIITLIEIAG